MTDHELNTLRTPLFWLGLAALATILAGGIATLIHALRDVARRLMEPREDRE